MKRMMTVLLVMVMLVVLGVWVDASREADYNDGLCSKCDGYYVERGTVFPYTQYKCTDCGHTVLH